MDLAGVDERFRSGVEARHAVLVSGPEINASPRPSLSDLAAHSVGYLDGPTDLSTSARHIEEFGE